MIKRLVATLLIINATTASLCLAQTVDDVRSFVKDDTDKVLAIVNGPEDQKDAELTKVFNDVVDSVWMARFAIGANWRSLTPQQQGTYIEAYKSYLLKIYLPKFEQYNAEKYEINSIEDLGDNQFIVHMTVLQVPPKPGIKLDYRVKCIEGNCYIRDLVAENISMVSSQRADFTAVINNSGFDGLLATLDKKSVVKE